MIEVGDLVCYKIHFITAQHFPTRLGLAVAIINANAKMPLSLGYRYQAFRKDVVLCVPPLRKTEQ